MATLYDLMLMLDADLPEEQRTSLVASARTTIESRGGNLVSANSWGTRKMAYEIDHRSEAAYYLFQFEGPSELLDELNRTLKIADGLLRFRIIRQPPGTKPAQAPAQPSAPVAESRAPSDEAAPAPAPEPASQGA